MTNPEFRPSAVATRLVVYGALPAIADGRGFPNDSIATPGRLLSAENRSAAGLTKPGRTFQFAALGADVFLDLSGSEAAAWFTGADFDSAIDIFDTALRRAYPDARQTDDRPLKDDPSMRARGYRVEFAHGRRAFVEVLYAMPSAKSEAQSFTAKVTAQQVQAGDGAGQRGMN